MNAGPLPPGHWVNGPEGGGRAVGEACHILDLFAYLTGAPACEVTATAIRSSVADCSGDENFVATLRYGDGSVCTLLYTALGARDFPKEAMEIYADGRVVTLDDYRALEIHGGKGGGLRTTRSRTRGAGRRGTGSVPRVRDRERPGAHDGGRDGRGVGAELRDPGPDRARTGRGTRDGRFAEGARSRMSAAFDDKREAIEQWTQDRSDSRARKGWKSGPKRSTNGWMQTGPATTAPG